MKHTLHLHDLVLAVAVAATISNTYGPLQAQLASTELAGYLESADCTRITGWAMDKASSDPIKIAAFARTPNGVTERLIGYLPAARSRADVETVFGHGMHGFSFLTPEALSLGREVQVNVYAVSSDGKAREKLQYSPQTLNCEKKTAAVKAVKQSSQEPSATAVKTIGRTKYETTPTTLKTGFSLIKTRKLDDFKPIYYPAGTNTSAEGTSGSSSSTSSVSTSSSSSSTSSRSSSSRRGRVNTMEENSQMQYFEEDLLNTIGDGQ